MDKTIHERRMYPSSILTHASIQRYIFGYEHIHNPPGCAIMKELRSAPPVKLMSKSPSSNPFPRWYMNRHEGDAPGAYLKWLFENCTLAKSGLATPLRKLSAAGSRGFGLGASQGCWTNMVMCTISTPSTRTAHH